jgi:hypothetical protein
VASKQRTSALLIAGSLVLAVAILAGTAGLAWWRQQKATEEVGREIAFQFRDHPQVVRLIGGDASFAVDSMELDDKNEQAVVVLKGTGSNGTGLLRARIEKGEGADGSAGFNVVSAELWCEKEPGPHSLLPPK